MELEKTKTKMNLEKAFSGESQARNKYTYFASIAKKEGFEQIAQIFLEAADNEKEHAKIWFKYLKGISNTVDNLKTAISGEDYEYSTMYKQFAEEAEKEGFHEIADKFREVADIEKVHKKMFEKVLNDVENNQVFEKKIEVKWRCRNCGHVHIGFSAPESCPVCNHKQSYFEVLSECV
jgi:rubrerythrin